MNFDEAIQAHSTWKLKLTKYLRSPDGSLKAEEVCLDNKCALGLWIYGEGVSYTSMTEYGTLKSEHAKFHKAAAEVITKADAGKSVSEEVQMGADSPFAKASSAVVLAIMEMKKKAK